MDGGVAEGIVIAQSDKKKIEYIIVEHIVVRTFSIVLVNVILNTN
jgi:hypothetical protein